MNDVPENAWKRKLDETDVDGHTHRVSRPTMSESVAVLPLAYRLSKYMKLERRQGFDPVFDFKGIDFVRIRSHISQYVCLYCPPNSSVFTVFPATGGMGPTRCRSTRRIWGRYIPYNMYLVIGIIP